MPATGKQLCPESGPDLFFCIYVPGTHGHHFGTEGQHVPGLGQGKHVAADEFSLVITYFDKMSPDGKTVIFAAVPAGKRSAVKIDDSIFLAPLLLEIT